MPTELFSDDFESGSNGQNINTYSASWVNQNEHCALFTHNSKLSCNGGVVDSENHSYWTDDTPDDDQYGEGDVESHGGMGEGDEAAFGVGPRHSTTGLDGYVIAVSQSLTVCKRWDDSSGWYTNLGSTDSSTTHSNGTTLRLEAEGTTLTAKKDGSTYTGVLTSGTYTDSNHASGRIGLQCFTDYGSGYDIVRGGNLAGAAFELLPLFEPDFDPRTLR